MTDKPSNLEAELASLQPSPLSTECLRGIDQALSDSARPSWRLHPRRLLLITALAACFLLAATLLWELLSGHGHHPRLAGPAPVPSASQPIATIATYRQAIARGPGALDALLDREAAVSLRTRPNNNLLRAGFIVDPELLD